MSRRREVGRINPYEEPEHYEDCDGDEAECSCVARDLEAYEREIDRRVDALLGK